MSMGRIVDFHSHVLPGVDDGSASVEESMAMLRMEAEQEWQEARKQFEKELLGG